MIVATRLRQQSSEFGFFPKSCKGKSFTEENFMATKKKAAKKKKKH